MPSMMFLNLPVHDLAASMAYYKALGFEHNPQFTDDTAACIVFSETIFAMLLTHEKFLSFSPKPIPDPVQFTQALYGLSRESREAVDEIADAGLAAGGSEARPAQDYGFMYSRAIADIDGHIWEYIWMDMSQMPTE
jgi:predicted lactoylglutathione lyase